MVVEVSVAVVEDTVVAVAVVAVAVVAVAVVEVWVRDVTVDVVSPSRMQNNDRAPVTHALLSIRTSVLE